MKKKDVPQDDSNLQTINMTEVVYVTDDDGNYTTAKSKGWEIKSLALDESIDLINERIENAKKEVEDGKSSPIVYFMEKSKMDWSVLSNYVGFWQWRVKRHAKPKNFKKLNDSTLQKYASAFGISLSELKNFGEK